MATTDWKSKASENASKKKQLNKRIKELTKSRDDWKEKSKRHKERADALTEELWKIKKKLNEIIEIQ